MTGVAHPTSPVLRALRPEPHRGDQVAAGVVVLTTLVLLLEVRFADAWTAGPRLAVAALATAFVGAMAVLSPVEAEPAGTGPAGAPAPRAYQTVLYVTTCLLVLLTLVELSDALGARGLESAGASVWITLVAGLVALAFSLVRNASYCTLVAAILFGVCLMAGVEWIFDPDGVEPVRWTLLVVLAADGLGAVMLRDRRRRHAVMLIDAGGLAVLALVATALLPVAFVGGGSTMPWGWLLVVFAVACGLVAYAGADREPGPGYLGVAALAAFAFLAGRSGGDATLIGWPLLLAAIAVAFLALGLRPSRPLPPEPGVEDVPLPPGAVPLPPRGEAPPPVSPPADEPPTDEF